MLEQIICTNCKAQLDIEKIKNGIIKCPYCRTSYKTKGIKLEKVKEEQKEEKIYASMIGDREVELTIYGEKRKFYIGEVEMCPVELCCCGPTDPYIRNQVYSKPKIKLKLIEY